MAYQRVGKSQIEGPPFAALVDAAGANADIKSLTALTAGANQVLAGPDGAGGLASPRALVAGDLPGALKQIAAVAAAANKAIYFDGSGLAQLEDRISNASWTAGITCATPGDLAVSITTNTGTIDKRGSQIDLALTLVFTLTYTTAAGNFVLTGLPYVADSVGALSAIPLVSSTAFPWPTSVSQLYLAPQNGLTTALVQGPRPSSTAANLAVTAFTSGTAYTLRFRGRYRTT